MHAHFGLGGPVENLSRGLRGRQGNQHRTNEPTNNQSQYTSRNEPSWQRSGGGNCAKSFWPQVQTPDLASRRGQVARLAGSSPPASLAVGPPAARGGASPVRSPAPDFGALSLDDLQGSLTKQQTKTKWAPFHLSREDAIVRIPHAGISNKSSAPVAP